MKPVSTAILVNITWKSVDIMMRRMAYNSFVERNSLNKVAPYFNIRVIEIYLQGGFPKLVIDSKKNFSNTYGLNAEYWRFFDIKAIPGST